MKSKYKYVLASGVMSTSYLNELTKSYTLVSTFNTQGKVAYVFKKKNFFARLINKIF